MRLGVNIDHVATLRQARLGINPDPLKAAKICERAGADSIVVHLREDRRHIQDRDVKLLKKQCKIMLNLEMSMAPEIVDIACRIKPDRSTLVPEKRQELTTEGGLDVFGQFKKVSTTINKLQSNGINVSLFIDPTKKQIKASKDAGCKLIELHTGKYADAQNYNLKKRCLKELESAARFAKEIGLTVFAGHGLDYNNVKAITKLKEVEELNIGYSIVCNAIFAGLQQAVRQMRRLIPRD